MVLLKNSKNFGTNSKMQETKGTKAMEILIPPKWKKNIKKCKTNLKMQQTK